MGPARLAAVQNALLIGVSWLLIPFLGSLRAHGAILGAFGAGAGAMAVLGQALADPGTAALLTAFNASFAVTDAVMMACIVQRDSAARSVSMRACCGGCARNGTCRPAALPMRLGSGPTRW